MLPAIEAALILLSTLAAAGHPQAQQALTRLEGACMGWRGPVVYEQAHQSTACQFFGILDGEQSARDRPPTYR